jgi:hypothetical protein
MRCEAKVAMMMLPPDLEYKYRIPWLPLASNRPKIQLEGTFDCSSGIVDIPVVMTSLSLQQDDRCCDNLFRKSSTFASESLWRATYRRLPVRGLPVRGSLGLNSLEPISPCCQALPRGSSNEHNSAKEVSVETTLFVTNRRTLARLLLRRSEPSTLSVLLGWSARTQTDQVRCEAVLATKGSPTGLIKLLFPYVRGRRKKKITKGRVTDL